MHNRSAWAFDPRRLVTWQRYFFDQNAINNSSLSLRGGGRTVGRWFMSYVGVKFNTDQLWLFLIDPTVRLCFYLPCAYHMCVCCCCFILFLFCCLEDLNVKYLAMCLAYSQSQKRPKHYIGLPI